MDPQFQHKAHTMATGHPFSHLVCQHGARDDIANGKDGGNRGLEFVINLDAAAFVQLNTHAFKIQAIGVGLATYGARSTHIGYHMLANLSRCANLVERVCMWVELLLHQTLLQWSRTAATEAASGRNLPVDTSTTSASSTSASPPFAGSTVSFTMSPDTSAPETLVPSLKLSPCFCSDL